MSQRNPRLARRKYLDSVSNEGIGTYLEEMLLHHGLFDDSPHTRKDIWAYCRLRMLRCVCVRPSVVFFDPLNRVVDDETVRPPQSRC